jgi:NAD(P)H dehydrogenase (quinone)
MTIGITGATGQLGRLVVQKLKTRVPTSDIVALVRNPAKAGDLGVAVRQADYDRPDTLASALEGIGTLLMISASEIGKRLAQHHNVIEAAKKAGVKRIVYTSLLHADKSPINLASEHLPTENEIKASGIPYTILRNGWYTENYTGSIGGALAGGAFLGSAGKGRISSAARADFADAAVAVVTGTGHEGRTYELAGDTSWTLDDLAKEISRQTGKSIPYRDLPEAEYAKVLEGFGIPQPVAGAIASWDTGAAKGGLLDDGRQLSKLIGHPTTPMAETVRDALRAQQG